MIRGLSHLGWQILAYKGSRKSCAVLPCKIPWPQGRVRQLAQRAATGTPSDVTWHHHVTSAFFRFAIWLQLPIPLYTCWESLQRRRKREAAGPGSSQNKKRRLQRQGTPVEGGPIPHLLIHWPQVIYFESQGHSIVNLQLCCYVVTRG